MNTIKIEKNFKGMVASKGLSGIETENTIFAFLAASNRSYFGMSCDLSISKDNEIILTKDDTLLRLGLLNLYIPSFSYKELKKFSLIDRKTSNLNPNVFIPKLSDYLSICKAYRKVAFIHLNHVVKAKEIDQVLSEVDTFYKLDNVYFLSENKSSLDYLKKKVNSKHLFFKAKKASHAIVDYCLGHNLNVYIEDDTLSKDTIKNLHLAELKIAVGEVNDKSIAESLVVSDVDLIFTSILE